MTDSVEENDTVTRTKCSFSSLGLHNWLSDQCKSMGISKPTPVQQHCIPPILRGQDCIGCAKTGSGKTAAFALPILQKLSEDPYGIFCLVITPTRELAFQIGDQFRVLGKPIGVKDSVVIGGFDMVRQGLELSKKPHIVIATPGRLADHINSTDTCDLKNIKFLVLDEADRLLEGNYGPDLEVIFDAIPAKRQTLLFSATITDTMKELRKVSMNKPYYWISKAPVATVDELDQRYSLVPAQVKDAYLMQIVHDFCTEKDEQSIIIFTSTCKYCHSLAIMLRQMDVPCVALHSLVKQRTRLASLAMFKSNQVHVLVATDVASRGLDIPAVQLVINHNVPASPKDYIHRVGRTARAGRGGMAITLVTQFDVQLVKSIEKLIHTKLIEYKVDEKKVLLILNEVALAKREAEMKLEELEFGEKRAINKRKQMILDGKDPDEEERKKRKLQKKRRRERHELETSTSTNPQS
ncbi:probable ATP-dependent RNA helicase DDX49 [Asterias rubens]|uniref:probable ATP-dependent RNA helicase DDX49 n=1 Tax=Asterias rubens TaxID=7604 RepID=UPI001455950D|nr:probable ATP-dependent RNA helicase DDX49 [Asterias rubens]